MEQPNNIDQQFRERLQGAEVPPPAFVWPNVEHALRQRRRRLFFWMWFGLGLATAGSWALWTTLLSDKQSVTTPVVVVPQMEESRVTGVGAIATRDEDYARVSPGTEHPALYTGKQLSKGQKGSPTGRAAQDQFFKNLSSSPVPSGPAFTLPDNSANPVPGLNQPASLSTDFIPAFSDNVSSTSAARVLTPLPAADYTFLSKKGLTAVLLPKAKPYRKRAANKNCYNFAPHAKVWLFDAYAGPSLPKRELTATVSDYENYLGQRRTTEHADWAFHAGLRGSLLLGRHFLLRSGLHYEQMTEVFEYADPDFIQVTIRQTTKIIDNVPVTVIDTIGIDYGEHYVKTYNRYGRLDVPLMAGVEFRQGRAGLSLQAGASLNVYFWKRGTILDTQSQPLNFTPDDGSGKSPVFRQRAGWSTTASAQFFYHLRPRLRVFAEPYGSHNLRPLTLDGQPISQRYTTWGLKLGLTKILD